MLAAGAVVQVANFQTGAVATGTTVIPFDDTIPQNTEGNEYMSLAFTPESASNKLKIEIVFQAGASTPARLLAALFQDSTANALAAAQMYIDTASAGGVLTFTHWMTAGTASATTFKVRGGLNVAGTTSFNGSGGTRVFGGVAASSITITEIAA